MTTGRNDRRAALLGELESIRTLLGEDAQDTDDLELLVKAGKIPLLLPEDNIPTLSAADSNEIPVLTAVTDDSAVPPAPAVATARPDPLEAIRQAAAKVAAARQREPAAPQPTGNNIPTPPPPAATAAEREKLVDDIVKAALPRVELLLRELVQEALLQDKLRNGKR